MCRACDEPLRYVPVLRWAGAWYPLHLPRGAYLDHLAFICSGPDHHLCARGRLRFGTARVYLAQWGHAFVGRGVHRAGRSARLCDAYCRALPLALGGCLCAGLFR
jgi:hypothetical protein